jgi:hypothetical protein
MAVQGRNRKVWNIEYAIVEHNQQKPMDSLDVPYGIAHGWGGHAWS